MARMRSYRKNRRPGNRPMTPNEWGFIEQAKICGCIPCLIRVEQGKMMEVLAFKYAAWDHFKHTFRRGHLYGCATCDWHHQGHARPDWSRSKMVMVYGPSKHYGVGPYHTAFGSDDYLILRQFKHLGYEVDLDGGEAEVDRIVKIVRG